jgi:hypothetical protein
MRLGATRAWRRGCSQCRAAPFSASSRSTGSSENQGWGAVKNEQSNLAGAACGRWIRTAQESVMQTESVVNSWHGQLCLWSYRLPARSPCHGAIENRPTYAFPVSYFADPSLARVMLVTVSVDCSSSCPFTESDICSLSFTREETTRPAWGSNANSPVPF